MTDRDRIIDKIRKVLALAASPNEAEAAAAMDKVQEMLALHNLSLADLHQPSPFVVADAPPTADEGWRMRINKAVAKLYFCNFFMAELKPGLRVGAFIGEQHNVAVAQLMATYCIDAVVRLSDEAAQGQDEPDLYRDSFREMCTLRLLERIRARIEATQRATRTATGTTLPALASLYDQAQAALQGALDSLLGPAGSFNAPSLDRLHPRGAHHGYSAGDDIGLDTQVHSGSGPRVLGKD